MLAGRVDRHLAATWKAHGARPAAVTTDEVFIRRVYLDLAGRIPPAAEVRAFLADQSSDRRARLVIRLTETAAHARHAALFWRRAWVPQADVPRSPLASTLDPWLTAQLRANRPYDRLARDLLTAGSGSRSGSPAAEGAPTTFLSASEHRPENLAANTTRAFLGINLDCAQCHNHPFARWTRDQFWQTAAFFTRPPAAAERKGGRPVRLEVAIPDTGKRVGPRLLTGQPPRWPSALEADTGRRVLAEWVTGKDNPYFARNAVNRAWAGLFGAGLVEPLDDLASGEDQGPHAKLLDELAKAFADGGFDLRYLTRALVLTRAYQFSSADEGGSEAAAGLFARAAVRGLTGEQLYDSLRAAAGLPVDREDLDPVGGLRERERFAERFRVEGTGSAQRSILQALALMNGELTTRLTDPVKSPALRAVAAAPFLDTRGRVESLYLAALARRPTAEELAPLVRYVDLRGGRTGGGVAKALADVLWALLNSSEFNTNH